MKLSLILCCSWVYLSCFRPRDNGPEGMEPDGVIEVIEEWQVPVGYTRWLQHVFGHLPLLGLKIKVLMFKWSLTNLSSLHYRATGRRWWTALMTWTCTSLFSGESMPMVLRNPLPFNRGPSSLASRVSFCCLLVLIECSLHKRCLNLRSKI